MYLPMKNMLTFDIEEWFQVNKFSAIFPYEKWEDCETRIERDLATILRILDSYNTRATFFILGWIAERHPEMVRDIHNRGHEVASHGYKHRTIDSMAPDEFKADLERSIRAIREITKEEVVGFRAPNYSLTDRTLWAKEILKQVGIKYDSSIYPTNMRKNYGIRSVSPQPFELSPGLHEFPLSSISYFKLMLPFGSGGYFRFFPIYLTRYWINQYIRRGWPVMLNIHSWEFDPQQPRVTASKIKQFRHYYHLNKTEKYLRLLLDHFDFTAIKDNLP